MTKQTNMPFDKIKMCKVILCVVPFSLLVAYWSAKGIVHFLTLTEAIIGYRVLLQFKYGHTQKLLEKVCGHKKKNDKASDSTAVTLMNDVIRKKDK